MKTAVVYVVSPTGFRVEVRRVDRYSEECLAGESLDAIRDKALAKAVEVALQRRIPLVNVVAEGDGEVGWGRGRI